MRKLLLAPSLLAWTLAAVLAVVLPGAHSARAANAKAEISEALPGGVTLAKASVAQTATALHDAVAKHPDQAASLTEAALKAKTKSKGKKLSSDEVKLLVNAAIIAAPDKSSDIMQVALSEYPQYADQINEVAASPGVGNAPSGFNTPQDLYGGFGVGFGAGFPGSPGFTGSPPSGAIALPGGDLTSVVNG